MGTSKKYVVGLSFFAQKKVTISIFELFNPTPVDIFFWQDDNNYKGVVYFMFTFEQAPHCIYFVFVKLNLHFKLVKSPFNSKIFGRCRDVREWV